MSTGRKTKQVRAANFQGRKLGLPSLAGAREEDKPKAGEEEATRDTIKEKGHNKREKGRVRTDNGPREKLHLSEGERREGRERRRDGRFEKEKDRAMDGSGATSKRVGKTQSAQTYTQPLCGERAGA